MFKKRSIYPLFFITLSPNLQARYQLPPLSSSSTASAAPSLQEISKGVADVAAAANKALVYVSISKHVQDDYITLRDMLEGNTRREQVQKGSGSGFFVDLEKGYILTNNHVIAGADEIFLKLSNDVKVEGVVIGRSEAEDVAVIQVKDKNFKREGLSSLTLGDSEKVRVGDFALALGAPFGLEASISFGVISATGRGNLNISKKGDYIQTDATINPGNSGGPLVTMDGTVLGMNTAIFSSSGSSAGIGFAIPAKIVRRVADALINGEKVSSGYIGLSMIPLTPQYIENFKLPKTTSGVVVAEVNAGSPAEKGGIKPGDIIIKINKENINTSQDIQNLIQLIPNETANIQVLRDGKTLELKVNVASEQPKLARADIPFEISDLTSKIVKKYRIQSKFGAFVESSSHPALKSGDVVLAINNVKVKSADEVKEVLAKSGKVLFLHIERQQRIILVRVDV